MPMTHPRRQFLTGLAAAAGVPALSPALSSAAELFDQALAGAVDRANVDFWNNFLQAKAIPLSKAPARTRGDDPGREPFFFHQTREKLIPAVDIPMSELVPDGDVSVTVNMSRFRPSEEDRASFERFQNAQLRLDFLQDVSLIEVLDTLAWTVIASLSATKDKKLPPMQELN